MGGSGAAHKFGTFGGVFTPTILTIFGVIMFMRAGFVVGQAGVALALLILVLATSITFLTSLSLSAIATNTEVRGGGAYYLISRTLGPEFGGAIGLTLFPAQALSVPFYVLGFVEALARTWPGLAGSSQAIAIGVTVVLFVVCWVGTGWVIRVQYLILVVLFASIAAFLLGAALGFDPALLRTNLAPAPAGSGPGLTFWTLFAIYFPAVTGIMAGVNMSGDLKDPATSLPRGTLVAVGLSFVVYAGEIVLLGAALPRGELLERPFDSLVTLAGRLHVGPLVTVGVFAATLSSALGSFVGAPRVLQALARDDIFRQARPFAQGSAKGDDPQRALVLTLLIALAVLLALGGQQGGQALNTLASIVTMFFLATYGVTNWAAWVEATGGNPSFRPRFRWFHRFLALAGAAGCAGTALLIDAFAAVCAGAITTAVWWQVRRQKFSASFGDARRGFAYMRARNSLLRLAELRNDAKNWRPTALVLSGNPHGRLTLVTYALWLEAQRGVVTLVDLMVGDPLDAEMARRRAANQEVLERFVRENHLPAFAESAVVPDFDQGLTILLQTHSLGPLKPNLVMFGWCTVPERVSPYWGYLRCAAQMGLSLVLFVDRGLPAPRERRRIDLWWRGQRNGSLMLILAHLLRENADWARARVRVMRACAAEAERGPAESELKQLVDAGRIEADVVVVVSRESFGDVLRRESNDATVVFLGFDVVPAERAADVHRALTRLVDGLPTTLLINSSGAADLLA